MLDLPTLGAAGRPFSSRSPKPALGRAPRARGTSSSEASTASAQRVQLLRNLLRLKLIRYQMCAT